MTTTRNPKAFNATFRFFRTIKRLHLMAEPKKNLEFWHLVRDLLASDL